MRLSIERAGGGGVGGGGVQVLSGSAGDPGEPFPVGAVQAAARAGLQAAAVKAKLLADAEERNVLLLVRKVIVWGSNATRIVAFNKSSACCGRCIG